MDLNLFALERQVETKLAEVRAASARQVVLSSLGAERHRFLSALVTAALRWAARRQRPPVPRAAATVPTPSAP